MSAVLFKSHTVIIPSLSTVVMLLSLQSHTQMLTSAHYKWNVMLWVISFHLHVWHQGGQVALLAAGYNWYGSTFCVLSSTASASELSPSVDEAEQEDVRSSESQLLWLVYIFSFPEVPCDIAELPDYSTSSLMPAIQFKSRLPPVSIGMEYRVGKK